jgi:hypothetical protein
MTRTDAKAILVIAVLGLGPLVYGLYAAYADSGSNSSNSLCARQIRAPDPRRPPS